MKGRHRPVAHGVKEGRSPNCEGKGRLGASHNLLGAAPKTKNLHPVQRASVEGQGGKGKGA